MHDFLFKSSFVLNNGDGEKAELGDLEYFLKKDLEFAVVDKDVFEKFKLSDFGSKDEPLNINGSKELIEHYKSIDATKIDFVEKINNIEYMGFSDKGEIILHFKDGDEGEGITATGVYDFTKEFLDKLFNIHKYAKFCIEKKYVDLIRENLEELFEKLKETERQYRLIKKDESLFLRAITSTRYKNYDNHIAIYLVLLMFNKYTKDSGKVFNIVKADLSDSEILVNFEYENPIVLEDFGKVYLGAVLSNSEIREKKFTLELRYRIESSKNEVSFGAIPPLKDSLFSIQHSASTGILEERLGNIRDFDKKYNDMIEGILSVGKVKKFNDDNLFKLFKKITSSNLSAGAKNKFQDIYDKNVVNNTLTIIEVFNKTSEITSDLEERMYLERIYHQMIMELTKEKEE